MSVERMFHWTCDRNLHTHCATPVATRKYGGMDGWFWYLEDRLIKHACDDCAKSMMGDGWKVDPTDPKRLLPS